MTAGLRPTFTDARLLLDGAQQSQPRWRLLSQMAFLFSVGREISGLSLFLPDDGLSDFDTGKLKPPSKDVLLSVLLADIFRETIEKLRLFTT